MGTLAKRILETLAAICAAGYIAACSHSPANGTLEPADLATTSATPLPLPDADTLRVVVLGSGTPIPSRTQASAAILVEAGDQRLLIDCGRGCGTRLNAYDPSLYSRIDSVFLSHLHSDHVVGIPDIWLNGWSMGRINPLAVHGPVGTAAMMSGLRGAFDADITYRTGYTSEADPEALRQRVTEFGELEDGSPTSNNVFAVGDLRVTAFPVVHADLPAYGFRVDYGNHSVLVSGDTTVTPALSAYGKGVDLALMEVLSPAMEATVRKQFEPAKADAVVALHLTAEQAGATLADIAPGLGAYYHTVATCATDPGLIATTRESYSGRLAVARDLLVVDIDASGVRTTYLGEDPADCTG